MGPSVGEKSGREVELEGEYDGFVCLAWKGMEARPSISTSFTCKCYRGEFDNPFGAEERVGDGWRTGGDEGRKGESCLDGRCVCR